MDRSRRMCLAFVASATVIFSASLCLAAVFGRGAGNWPETWPKELEPYREQARTFDVACGIQETVYEIPFKKRDDFEKVWPAILKVKDKAAPLILESSPFRSWSTLEVGVLIRGPVGGGAWTDPIKSLSGELPEYVVKKDADWVPWHHGDWVREEDITGFIFRARTDIVLVTDGKIVDLNRIRLPENTPIIDKRKFEHENKDTEN